jgi:hypothetical protein
MIALLPMLNSRQNPMTMLNPTRPLPPCGQDAMNAENFSQKE